MSAEGNAQDLSGRLSPRELEVLRLLASGHTVKTIAAQLGRSEASIHERLRDARRKTGVGSSRELARMLDNQKIWDDFPDLRTAVTAGDEGGRAGARRLLKAKGIVPMLIVTALAVVGFVTVHPGGERPANVTDAASLASPLAGRWTLDTASVPAAERPQQVSIVLRQGADRRWSTSVAIVAADGSSRHGESLAATDGVPVPIKGTLGFADSVALRQPAANTLVMSLRQGGALVSTRVYAAAKDGRHMTETIVWPGSQDAEQRVTRFIRAQ